MTTMAAAMSEARRKAAEQTAPVVGSVWLIPTGTGYGVGVVIESGRDVVIQMEDASGISRIGCDLARWGRKVSAGEVWQDVGQELSASGRPLSGWELLNGVTGQG